MPEHCKGGGYLSIDSQACAAEINWDAVGSAGGRDAGESPDGLVGVDLEGINGEEEKKAPRQA